MKLKEVDGKYYACINIYRLFFLGIQTAFVVLMYYGINYIFILKYIYIYIQCLPKVLTLHLYLGSELEFCKTAKHVLNEFVGEHFWLKIFGPGRLGGASLKFRVGR